ncbi:MAG: tRNA pseudouridine(55) synthase TruB [Gammaproteobacteria bacterium]|nr:tRNA pseudouridine(55) synthase TruB [Gammaproteobacteria bacterium]
MQFKRIKRPISGVLLLDKPFGISSNAALQHAKRLYQAAKAGHTGNLDPIATGLLPVCFGEATKFSQFLLDANKTYQAAFKLGQTTTTGDSEGEVISRCLVNLSRKQVEQALQQFIGPILQVPPMYSALKFQGKALYTYARAGVEIEREAREVRIYSLTLDAFSGDELTVTVECSKGTYIRVLGEDIGRALGCGAFMQALRRTHTGGFEIGRAVTLEQLEAMNLDDRDARLLPPDCLLSAFPKVSLDGESAYYFRQGQAIWLPKQQHQGVVVLYDEKQRLLGIGEVAPDGKIAPKRLVVESDGAA